jgi:hypothetical protein
VQHGFILPQNPAQSRVDKTKFVAGGIDRVHTRHVESPLVFRVREWCDECARGTVNVNGDIEASAFLQVVHCAGPKINNRCER